MAVELKTDSIELYIHEGWQVWLEVNGKLYRHETLDAAYIQAAHDRAGTEPPPF
jgi:hypothetical protein